MPRKFICKVTIPKVTIPKVLCMQQTANVSGTMKHSLLFMGPITGYYSTTGYNGPLNTFLKRYILPIGIKSLFWVHKFRMQTCI